MGRGRHVPPVHLLSAHLIVTCLRRTNSRCHFGLTYPTASATAPLFNIHPSIVSHFLLTGFTGIRLSRHILSPTVFVNLRSFLLRFRWVFNTRSYCHLSFYFKGKFRFLSLCFSCLVFNRRICFRLAFNDTHFVSFEDHTFRLAYKQLALFICDPMKILFRPYFPFNHESAILPRFSLFALSSTFFDCNLSISAKYACLSDELG